MSTEFHDFEVEISSKGPSQYVASVIRSPAGETNEHPVTLKFAEPSDLKRLIDKLERAVLQVDDRGYTGRASPSERVLQEFGREMFRSVFSGPIRDAYARSKGAPGDLRIKLRIKSAELAGLPWEFLFDEGEVPPYVSLRQPVVRYLSAPGPAQLMCVKGPLRILGMVSDPSSEEWPKLDSSRERQRMAKGIDKLQRERRVVFEWVPGGTGKDLMDKLLEGEWHVFHFIGHGGVEVHSPSVPGGGEPNEFDESGFVVMVDENGKPVKKYTTDLATMLINARKSLRLVVLNCCESAKTNPGEKFASPATGLMLTGWLPAVIAMQFPISDQAAIKMSEGFYKALAANHPIDDAVTIARRFMQDDSRIEWGIPVLHMRSADGQIFEVDNPVVEPEVRDEAVQARISGEQVDERRKQIVDAAEAAGDSGVDLEPLARAGRELLVHLKNDQEFRARLARIYFKLGISQQRKSEVSKAAASFAQAIELDPYEAEYRIRRANFNARVGFYENALVDIADAIKLKPDNAEFYWNRGIVHSIAGGPDVNQAFVGEALKAFDAAIARNPQEAKYFVSRANARAQLKKFPEALADMDRALELAPDNADLMAQRAKIANQAI